MDKSSKQNDALRGYEIMDQVQNLSKLRQIVSSIESKPKSDGPVTGYRFDIFKGIEEEGKVTKVRSVGSAYLREGHRTYVVNLKTFLNEKYYLLPNSKSDVKADFIILTREPAQNIPRKYFWNSVGDGIILDGLNHGLMKLAWDVLADNLYMSLHPMQMNLPVDHVAA